MSIVVKLSLKNSLSSFFTKREIAPNGISCHTLPIPHSNAMPSYFHPIQKIAHPKFLPIRFFMEKTTISKTVNIVHLAMYTGG